MSVLVSTGRLLDERRAGKWELLRLVAHANCRGGGYLNNRIDYSARLVHTLQTCQGRTRAPWLRGALSTPSSRSAPHRGRPAKHLTRLVAVFAAACAKACSPVAPGSSGPNREVLPCQRARVVDGSQLCQGDRRTSSHGSRKRRRVRDHDRRRRHAPNIPHPSV